MGQEQRSNEIEWKKGARMVECHVDCINFVGLHWCDQDFNDFSETVDYIARMCCLASEVGFNLKDNSFSDSIVTKLESLSRPGKIRVIAQGSKRSRQPARPRKKKKK